MMRSTAESAVCRLVAVIAAAGLLLAVPADRGGVVEAQTRELATVGSAELPLYAVMDSTSRVLKALLRGDLVEIDRVIVAAEGEWCSVTEVLGQKISGYVRCEGLVRRRPRPLEALGLIEKPAPEPRVTPREREEPSTGRYTVQVAALVLEANAFSLKERLEKLGYAPAIRLGTARVTRHRVSAGAFDTRREAESTAGRLRGDGFAATLAEGPDGKIRVEIGSSVHLDKAIDLARELERKNYRSTIVSEKTPTPVHQVRVGGYQNREEAAAVLEALQRQGFAPVIVRE